MSRFIENGRGRQEEIGPIPQKVALVFPGQGSQSVGMGEDLCKRSPRAREVFEQADDALGFFLSRLCFKGPDDQLRDTVNAQPAILTVSWAQFREHLETANVGRQISPAFVAGHSLGEYTALVAAGALDFSDALRLVRERGRLMQEASKINPGGMAAILGLEDDTVEEVCMNTGAEIANINAPGQIVISGRRLALAQAIDLCRAQGARRVMPLEVSGAFHSSLMRPALDGMLHALERIAFKDPTVPVVGNAKAQLITSGQDVKDALLSQLCNPVQWRRSVDVMIQQGVGTFVEAGPGEILTGLIKRIARANPDVKATNKEVKAYTL